MEKMNKPIRIAHIIGKWVGGGVEAVIMNYYRHINKEKIQFDFICDTDSVQIPYEEIHKLGGRVFLISPYQKLIQYQKDLRLLLKRNHYKIIHSHINTLSIFPMYAAKRIGIPIRIAHSHSTTNKKEIKKNLIKSILRHFSKLFPTNYICCSELAGRYLFGNKIYDRGKVTLLNNAIDLERFVFNENTREKKRKELQIEEDQIVIGHIGRFVKQKNHKGLLEIFSEIHRMNDKTVLLFIGQGPLEAEIKDDVERLQLSSYVRFLGQRGDANELYQAFDVFLLPSLYEGLPVVGVEAQAAGLLCFLSDDMTRETKVLETTQFLSLEESPTVWAKTILHHVENFCRLNASKEITEKGFNIQQEAIYLERYYETL